MTCIGVLCMRREGLLGLFVRRLGRLGTVAVHANVGAGMWRRHFRQMQCWYGALIVRVDLHVVGVQVDTAL